VGDPPTFILYGRKGGRVALPSLKKGTGYTKPPAIGGGWFEPWTAKGAWATRPHLSWMAAKEGESPSLL